MKLENKVNSQTSIISNINNKKKASSPSVIDNLNIIKALNLGNYKKINFATQSCEFQKRSQPELSRLPYSPPVEKLLLPYTYYEDDLVSPSDIFKNNITIENNSPTKIKLENMPMKTKNSNTKLINIDQKKFLINDFGINKIKQFFYNSIEKVQSTGKIQALVVKNKLHPRKEDLYSVKFYNKNKMTEIQKTSKQNTESVNEEKNPPISFSGKDKKQFDQAKNLKDRIYELEEKISSHKNFNQLDDKFKYTKSVQSLINECILSSSNERDSKFSATIETMNGVINKLNDELSSLQKNEEKIINFASGKNMFNSNESLNSNSSGYFSETTNESSYSSDEAENQNIKNNNITNLKNNELENKKSKKAEVHHKKTHITVKPKKITYQFNGKIYINRATMLRDMHISKEYNFQLNENSKQKILNDKRPDTKNLDAKLKGAEKTLNDLGHLQVEIKKEEMRFTQLKNQLKDLEHSEKA
ncbi:hypothetical protein [Providencia vermicola]|uniref:hypothetical protein n=1 Tax=Providencia vermicola TaxID=333965 RepID=UPI001CECDD0A|nr:hypothetical protein [Providencia vermicola]